MPSHADGPPVYHLAFDVHADVCAWCAQERTGAVVGEGLVPTAARPLQAVAARLRGEVHVVFEEGPLSTWLVEVFTPHVDSVVSCDPRRNHAFSSGQKSDRSDARWLCDLSRAGLVSPVYKGCEAVADLRELVALHTVTVQEVTRTKNRIKAIFRSRGIATPGARVFDPTERASWLAQLPGAGRRHRAAVLLATLDHLDDHARGAWQAMVLEARRHDAFALLQTVPGIGPVRAARLIAWLVSPHRFRSRRQLWAYAGLAVVHRTSGEWTVRDGELVRARAPRPVGLNRNHHPGLKHLFKGAGVEAVHTGGWAPIAQYHLARGLAPNLVRITIARRIAAICLSIWKRGVPYNPDLALRPTAD
ncbi:MAG: transposase [Alphaproteobacteria bacterium]|nr:transposase [Alphaproteobacteria bacterium]